MEQLTGVFCMSWSRAESTPWAECHASAVMDVGDGSTVVVDDGRLEAAFEICPDPRKLAELRSRTRQVLRGWELSNFHVDVAVLAAHELTVNALLHGGGPARLCLSMLDGRLRIAVGDTGPGEPTPGGAEPGECERGYGLTIVTNLTDTWGHHPTPAGKTVWCELLV